MIAALFTGISAAPWMRSALRYGAIALAVCRFLFALRRSGERAGRLAERLETWTPRRTGCFRSDGGAKGLIAVFGA